MESESSGEVGEQKRGFLKRVGCGKLVLGFLALLIVIAGCWYWNLSRDRSAFLRHVEALVQDAEASKPTVALADNAASVYQRAFGLYVPARNFRTGQDDYRYFDLENSKRVVNLDPKLVAKYLAGNAAALNAVRAAAGLPDCDFGLDLRDFQVSEHRGGMRQAVRLLCVSARIKARAGKPAEALGELAVALRVARDVGRGGLIPRMVRIACEGVIVAGIELALGDCEPDAASLEKFLVTLRKHHAERGTMEKCLILEQAHVLASFYGPLVSGKASAADVATARMLMPDLGLSEDMEKLEKARFWLWQKGGFVIKDARHFERVMERYIEAAAKPYPQALAEAEDIAAELEEPPAWWAGVSCMMIGAFSRIFRSDARLEAKLRVARLGVGCRLYKTKFGKYPEKLSDLSAKLPEHFKKLPADPFTGKPMIYKKTAKGCMIYSVAKDGKDDGGTRYNWKKPYDWVFELKR